MALVLELLASENGLLSQIVKSLPPLAMVKDKINLPASKGPPLLDKLSADMAPVSTSRLDGLCMEWSDRWLLVRGNSIPPIVRLIAEAPTVEAAQELCDRARQLSEQI